MRVSLFALVTMTFMLVLAPVHAQNSSASLVPVLSLLLDETPIDLPVRWNGQRVNEGQQLSASQGSVNLVSIDYALLPASFTETPELLSFDVTGACYQLFAGSENQSLYEFNVVATEPGTCTLSFQLIGSTQSMIDSLDVTITAKPVANDIYKIVANADISSGEAVAEGAFSFTNISSWNEAASLTTNPAAVFSDDNKPNMFEFTATYDGVPLKGVMLTTTRKIDNRNFSNLNIDSRTHVRFVDNQPALVGSGKVTGSAGNTNTFAFIATGVNTTLSGPTEGKEFQVGGKNKLNALCVDERIVGFGLFSNARTLSRISTSMVGFTDKDCTANNNRFEGTTAVYADFQSINTHIGTILRGRGTAHPLNSGKISTVEDQDINDPDYALYFLGLAERVSDAHEIVQVDSDTEFRPNVYIFDPFAISKIAKIRREYGTMVFKEPPEILVGIDVGDIIVGKPSSRLRDGFFREVTAKGQSNGLYYLRTKPATLDQLFKEGGFDLGDRELTFEDIDELVTPEYYTPEVVGPMPSKVTFGHTKTNASYEKLKAQLLEKAGGVNGSAPSSKGFLSLPLPNVSFDHVFLDADSNLNTTNDQWRTEGRFELGASINARFRCKGIVCQKPYFLLKFNFTEDFELSGHIFTDENEAINAKHTITSMKFGRIWLGPVSIRPQIDLNVILNGETDTDIEFGVDQFFTAELGLELDGGDWETINNQSFGISASPTPDYQIHDGTADVRARAALEGSVKLSGIRVGGVDAGIYTDVDAATPRDPLWEVTAGLNSEAYVEIDLLVTTIEAGPYELFDIPFNIVGGEAPELPVEISSIKVEGIEIENGVAVRSVDSEVPSGLPNSFGASPENPINVKVQVLDPQTGYDCCTITLTNLTTGDIIGTKNPGGVTNYNNVRFDITKLDVGVHTMEVKVVPLGVHPSEAIVETFTIRSTDLNAITSDCEVLDLETSEGDLNLTVNPGTLVLLRAHLSECGPLQTYGQDVAFYESPLGSSSLSPFLTIQTSNENGDAIAYVSAYLEESDIGTRKFVAKYVDRRGDTVASNDVLIEVESLIPQIIGDLGDIGDPVVELVGVDTSFNSPFEPCTGYVCVSPTIGGFKIDGSAKAQPSTLRLKAPIQSPMMAATPSNTEPHRVSLDNWFVGETAYFNNPFPVFADYEVVWSIDDASAVELTDIDGNGQITPSTSGWYRVTASYIHDTAPNSNRRFIKNQVFFISPNTDKKWRGYEQETIDHDASRLEMMTGHIGTSPI